VKALVIDRPHEIAFRDLEPPAYGPGDVLVRSHKVGLCQTDAEIFRGELDPRWVRYPVILGHEWSGTVAEVGADVTGVEPGDRVVCEGIIPCHRCARCRAGETNLCENYDHLGFTRPGGASELVVAPQQVVHVLPDWVSFDAAVLIEPASVVLRGLERARPTSGERVAVIGIGTLGSLALRLARLYSPAEVVALGIRDEELELARRLGADRVLNVLHDEAEPGFDLVLETAGATSAVELALRLPREGGRTVLLGIAGEGRSVPLEPDRLTLRDVSVIGTVSYTTDSWSRMVALVGAGLVDLDPIVTHRFPAAEFERAFDLLEHREGIVAKVVLEHVPD
jgi:2-desacetyl-2-hydroxyethyl bacteriochlorophyllide A dehydrogenase